MPKRASGRGLANAPSSTYVVRDLKQARLLADPLRLRILQAFADEPRTTKQVATLLGEKAPRLYRHVEALLDAGLLEFKEERPKRGTVEKYLQAVATQFEVDSLLFRADAPQRRRAAAGASPGALLEATRAELARCGPEGADDETPPLVARVEVRASERRIRVLRRKLLKWLEECGAGEEGSVAAQEMRAYSATIAFYPVPKK